MSLSQTLHLKFNLAVEVFLTTKAPLRKKNLTIFLRTQIPTPYYKLPNHFTGLFPLIPFESVIEGKATK
jgi:hypothetical protein